MENSRPLYYYNNYHTSSNYTALNERQSYLDNLQSKAKEREANDDLTQLLERTYVDNRLYRRSNSEGVRVQDKSKSSSSENVLNPHSQPARDGFNNTLPRSHRHPTPLPRSMVTRRPVSILEIPEEDIKEFIDPVYKLQVSEEATKEFIQPIYQNMGYIEENGKSANKLHGVYNKDNTNDNVNIPGRRHYKEINNSRILPSCNTDEAYVTNAQRTLGGKSVSDSSGVRYQYNVGTKENNYSRRYSMISGWDEYYLNSSRVHHNQDRRYYPGKNNMAKRHSLTKERYDEADFPNSKFYINLNTNDSSSSSTLNNNVAVKKPVMKVNPVFKSTSKPDTVSMESSCRNKQTKKHLPKSSSNLDLLSFTNQILEENSLINYEIIGHPDSESEIQRLKTLNNPPELPLRNDVYKTQNLHIEMLLKNERDYIDSLSHIQIYRDKCGDFQLKDLLKNVDFLMKLHNTLYQYIKIDNNVANLSKSFLMLVSDFDVYIYHVMNEPSIAKCLEKNKVKDSLIYESLRKTYLRPSYYFQTLEVIAKNETKVNKQSMKDAIAMLHEVYKRADSVLLLESVKKCSYDLKTHLPLLQHSTLHVQAPHWKKTLECFALLLDDILVISKKKEKNYIYVESIPMHCSSVSLGSDESIFKIEKERPKNRNINYIFWCKNEVIRDKWYDSIVAVIRRCTLRHERNELRKKENNGQVRMSQ